MSIMNLNRGKANIATDHEAPRAERTATRRSPAQPAVSNPAPAEEQLQLGNRSLHSVDRLTGMTADEIERVAEQVLDGADETAALLRELAARVRENGVFANERLARFLRVTNQCADIARSMQQSVERRDEPQPPQPKTPEELAKLDDAPGVVPEQPVSLEAIAVPKRPASS